MYILIGLAPCVISESTHIENCWLASSQRPSVFWRKGDGGSDVHLNRYRTYFEPPRLLHRDLFHLWSFSESVQAIAMLKRMMVEVTGKFCSLYVLFGCMGAWGKTGLRAGKRIYCCHVALTNPYCKTHRHQI